MTQTDDGVMWFGVDEGVMRYDGIEWRLLVPPDSVGYSTPTVLHPRREGGIYVGTYGGMMQFDEEKWAWVFPEEGRPHTARVSGLTTKDNVRVRGILESSNGDVWAATSWGAVRKPETANPPFTPMREPHSR